VSNHGTRWQSSVVTFGPLGRIAWTLGVLGVLVWFAVYAGPFGIVGIVVWVGWVVPRALKDIWRRAPLPEDDLSRLQQQAQRRPTEQAPHPVFDGEQPPPRW
jgi:hypothetical protein